MRRQGLAFFPAEFVALPASTLSSTLIDGVAWVDLSLPRTVDGKLFEDGREGWLAHVSGELAFIKIFEDIAVGEQAPGESEVEIYVNGSFEYAELEQQGRYAEIAAGGASAPWRVDWLLRRLPAHLDAEIGNDELVTWVRSEVATRRRR